MIHNHEFRILQEFLGNYNKEVYGRELTNLPLSQKAISLKLNQLEKKGILLSRKSGNMKYFKLNHKNTELKEYLILTELLRKTEFMKIHRKLTNVFLQDERIIGIFGSYARNTQTKKSDVDLFIIVKEKEKDYNKKGKIYDLDISIKYFQENEFKKFG